MLEITIAPEVIAKFKELLVEEDNEDAVFLHSRNQSGRRLKEPHGAPCEPRRT